MNNDSEMFEARVVLLDLKDTAGCFVPRCREGKFGGRFACGHGVREPFGAGCSFLTRQTQRLAWIFAFSDGRVTTMMLQPEGVIRGVNNNTWEMNCCSVWSNDGPWEVLCLKCVRMDCILSTQIFTP